MSDDIVKRLRDDYEKTVPLCTEAADCIERLRAALAAERERAVEKLAIWREQSDADERMIYKLRETLERIAAIEDKAVGGDWEEIEEARTIARAVLSETKGD